MLIKWELVIKGWLSLGLTAGVCFGTLLIIGSWFIAAVEPLSQGITNVATKRLQGRKFNIGLDWPFIAGRAEIGLVPTYLHQSCWLKLCFFQSRKWYLATCRYHRYGCYSSLLVVTRGKLLRMIILEHSCCHSSFFQVHLLHHLQQNLLKV